VSEIWRIDALRPAAQRAAHVLSAVAAFLMAAASVVGVSVPGFYPDIPWAAEALRGWDLVNALVEGVDKQRVYYVIYRSTIWRRATGFKPESYGGDNHNDHVHVSGYVADDMNGKDWQSVLALKEDDMPTVDEIWGKKYRDYVPNPDGTRPDRTTGELLSLAREDSHYARTEAEAIREELTNNPPGGLTEDQVRALVREELDKTRLGS